MMKTASDRSFIRDIHVEHDLRPLNLLITSLAKHQGCPVIRTEELFLSVGSHEKEEIIPAIVSQQ